MKAPSDAPPQPRRRHRLVQKRASKAGLPPGSLVFVGEPKTDVVRLNVIAYDEEHLDEHALATAEDAFPFRDGPTVGWINLDGLQSVETVRQIGEYYGIHALVLEDIVTTGQRPKLEEFDDYLYIVLKMLSYEEASRELRAEQISFIVGPRYVLTFQEKPGDVFDAVRHRLRSGKGRLRRNGTDYLAYALLDVIIDNYFVVLEAFGGLLEDVEEEVLGEPAPRTQQEISDLRRELILLRRAAWPVRELLSQLERSETHLIQAETRPFFRDAYDHVVQVIDIVESLRDVLSGMMDLYMSSLSNRMNEVMKFLTIIGTIFIPLTFIAGVYGMNFDSMPELHTHLGYPLVLLAMLLTAVALVGYFRRRKWL